MLNEFTRYLARMRMPLILRSYARASVQVEIGDAVKGVNCTPRWQSDQLFCPDWWCVSVRMLKASEEPTNRMQMTRSSKTSRSCSTVNSLHRRAWVIGVVIEENQRPCAWQRKRAWLLTLMEISLGSRTSPAGPLTKSHEHHRGSVQVYYAIQVF